MTYVALPRPSRLNQSLSLQTLRIWMAGSVLLQVSHARAKGIVWMNGARGAMVAMSGVEVEWK